MQHRRWVSCDLRRHRILPIQKAYRMPRRLVSTLIVTQFDKCRLMIDYIARKILSWDWSFANRYGYVRRLFICRRASSDSGYGRVKTPGFPLHPRRWLQSQFEPQYKCVRSDSKQRPRHRGCKPQLSRWSIRVHDRQR